MAYKLPNFNLTCRIIQAGGLGPFPLAGGVVVPCQLRLMKTGLVAASGVSGTVSLLLLVPKGTDIRPAHSGANADAVEIPNGSGLYYGVVTVYDMAKGFPNECRVAAVFLETSKPNAVVYPMP